MYKFVNTDEKIYNNEEVIKKLSKLEKFDCDVTIKRVKENGDYSFTCEVSNGTISRKATKEKPEFAAKDASDAFIDAVRGGKDKINTKRENAKRCARNQKAIKE